MAIKLVQFAQEACYVQLCRQKHQQLVMPVIIVRKDLQDPNSAPKASRLQQEPIQKIATLKVNALISYKHNIQRVCF